MAHIQEPDIIKGCGPEETFHRAIKNEIEEILSRMKSDRSLIEYFILDKFGLDLAIFMKWFDGSSTIRLFEIKAFVRSRQGGVGFGNRRGEGSQVDLLLLQEKQLILADEFIRWILVDGTKPKGTRRYAIFSSREAKSAAMGGVKRGKQNNLRVNQLMRNALTWDQLSEELKRFLGGSNTA